jgi:hypothetical protein
MALLDLFKRGAKRAGENLESYIGGLLGEDVSQLSEQERKQLRRQGMSAIFDAMARGTTPTQGLAGVAQMAGARLEQKRLQGRQQAAEQEMGRITGRLFGGAPAAPEDMGEDETGLGTVAIQSKYKQSPQEALARMYGTAAGRDVAQMAPGLLKTAEEMAAPDDYVYQSVSGVGLVAVNKKDPSDVKVVQSERARATGPSERFKILSPAEAQANNLPAGMTYQQNTVTGQITPLQGSGTELSDTDIRQYRAADIAIQNARGQIKNLQRTLAEVPAYKAIAGRGRGRLESSYSLALSAIRQLQNSGVLNVGELPFLEKALEDPTSFRAIATSPIQREKLQGQIDTVLSLLNEQEQVLKTKYNMPLPSAGASPAGAGSSGGPTSRGGARRAPSPQAADRAKSYY